jgi:hypothetical protein
MYSAAIPARAALKPLAWFAKGKRLSIPAFLSGAIRRVFRLPVSGYAVNLLLTTQ